MKIKVIQLSPFNQHDQYQFELLLGKKMWNPVGAYEFDIEQVVSGSSFGVFSEDYSGIVLAIPTKYYLEMINYINEQVKDFKWVLFILSGNEENSFPIERLQHPGKKIYYTTPNPTMPHFDLVDRFFGDGYAPQSELLDEMDQEALEKPLDLYFGGQNTQKRREQCIKVMKWMSDNNKPGYKIETFPTEGFYQGYDDPREYYRRLASTKIAPAPSGATSVDTFRLFEALQAMAVPLADTKTPQDKNPTDYWKVLFGEEPPFPLIGDWDEMGKFTANIMDNWPANVNRQTAWWIKKKRDYSYNLVADLDELTGQRNEPNSLRDQITIIIPVSPLPSHPSTEILDITMQHLKMQLPDCEIVLCFDGVRKEQEDRRQDYEEFTRRTLWKCLHDPLYKNVLPLLFDEHSHQVKMTRKALEYVRTDALLFVEGDAPICGDRYFDWANLVKAIISGDANVIRFLNEAHILEPHKHLALDVEPKLVQGTPLIRTIQWSSRPHLSSAAFYKKMLNNYFSPQALTYTEDLLYGLVIRDYEQDGEQGWLQWRLFIYYPEDEDSKRSFTTDGRAGDPKWDDKLIF